MTYSIVGGGLAGCVLASLLPNSIIYEKNKLGGLCIDHKNYQDLVHILHTDDKTVWDFVNTYTTVRPHSTLLKSYVGGELKQWPAKEITDQVVAEQMDGYNKKMWLKETPKEAFDRVIVSDDGKIFHNKYEGIPDFRRLFKNLTKKTVIIYQNVKDGDLDGKVILTGAVDEYFGYCFGKLPYRGMKAIHYESEIGLDADFITFSDKKVPFQRLVDYGRLGYEGQWIGVEVACDEKHYPMRDKDSEEMYSKYEELARQKGVILCGRLANYRYIDMDKVIEQVIKTVGEIHEN